MTDRDVLTEARELLARITPGPWTWAVHTTADGDEWAVFDSNELGVMPPSIAAAPDLVSRLADEVERLRGLKPDPDHPVEIRHGWLVETGYEPNFVPGYGYEPDTDAMPLMQLDGLPGWPDADTATRERDEALSAIERVRDLADAYGYTPNWTSTGAEVADDITVALEPWAVYDQVSADVAAALRESRTVRTVAELDALPHLSLVRESGKYGAVWERRDETVCNRRWEQIAGDALSRYPRLPARVLHRPDEDGAR